MSTSARPVSASLRRTALAGLVLALGACGHAGDDANLRVVLTVDGALVADCAVVEVQGAGGATAQALVDLAAGKGEYAVAVKRGALPAEVTLAVSAYTGHCDQPAARALATRAPPQTASFPAAGVAEVRVVLGLPDASLDADRDGYVARAAGGSDCGDDDVRVHPGAPQDCASERDTDCDTLVYCDDPDCAADPACVRPATAMAFAPAAVSRVAAACWPLTLEFRAVDGPASLARPTVLEFSQDSSGVQFFTDAACATLATRRPVAFGQKVLALYGRKATLGAATGTVTDLATTRPLAPATLAYTGVNHRLRFDGAPAALASGQCSGRVWVRLEGASGPFQVTGPTDVTLTASGPVADGVTFYAASDTCAAGGTTSLVRTLQSPESGFWLAFKASRPGRVVLTATDPGQPDQIAVDVGAGLPDHLWMAGLSGVQAGACSGPIDVELRDATDAVTAAPAALSFTFATTVLDPPGWAGEPVQLFADGACAAPAGPLPFAPGQSRAMVSFRSVRAPLTFGVVATALLAGAADAGPTAVQGRAQWNVKSGAPVALALAAVDGGVPALVRDGCTSAPLWLELQDALGNPAGATHQEDVVWGPLDAGLAFFPASATGCSGAPLGTVTLAQDQTLAGVLLSTLGRVAGPITVEARSAAWGRVTVSLPIPDATGHLAVQAPVAVEAGGCEPVQVSRRKAQGGPASWGEVTVQLTSSDPALTVHGDAACSHHGAGGAGHSARAVGGPAGVRGGALLAVAGGAAGGDHLAGGLPARRDGRGGAAPGAARHVHPGAGRRVGLLRAGASDSRRRRLAHLPAVPGQPERVDADRRRGGVPPDPRRPGGLRARRLHVALAGGGVVADGLVRAARGAGRGERAAPGGPRAGVGHLDARLPPGGPGAQLPAVREREGRRGAGRQRLPHRAAHRRRRGDADRGARADAGSGLLDPGGGVRRRRSGARRGGGQHLGGGDGDAGAGRGAGPDGRLLDGAGRRGHG